MARQWTVLRRMTLRCTPIHYSALDDRRRDCQDFVAGVRTHFNAEGAAALCDLARELGVRLNGSLAATAKLSGTLNSASSCFEQHSVSASWVPERRELVRAYRSQKDAQGSVAWPSKM